MGSYGDTPDLIVYGGTFDPPHAAHVDCVREALRAFPGSRVVVTPALAPAGAGGSHKMPEASFDDRLAMCELAFAPVDGLGRVEISRVEAELPAPNYTVETLREIQRERTPRILGLLMGADQFHSFAKWREPLAILSMADLIVVRREAMGDLIDAVGALGGALSLNFTWDELGKVARVHETGRRIFLIDTVISAAASRTIRKMLHQGEAPPTLWLSQSVATHIRSHRLYQAKGSS